MPLHAYVGKPGCGPLWLFFPFWPGEVQVLRRGCCSARGGVRVPVPCPACPHLLNCPAPAHKELRASISLTLPPLLSTPCCLQRCPLAASHAPGCCFSLPVFFSHPHAQTQSLLYFGSRCRCSGALALLWLGLGEGWLFFHCSHLLRRDHGCKLRHSEPDVQSPKAQGHLDRGFVFFFLFFIFLFFAFLIEANNESWGLPSQEAEAPKEQCSQCQRSTRTARGCLCIRTAPVGRCVIRIQVGEDAVPVWACVRIPLSTESADAASGELNVLAPA